MNITIKKIESGDIHNYLEDLAELRLQLDPDCALWTAQRLKEVLDAGTIIVGAVLEPEIQGERSRLIGVAVLVKIKHLSFDEGELHDFVVLEDFRAHGVGQRLHEALKAEAVAEGVSRIRLTSRGGREGAHRFYERNGYTRADTNVFQLRLM